MDELEWIENWFASECDGDWEHENIITISTTSNPGWSVKIDLDYTNLENLDIEYKLQEKSDIDWFGFSIKNKVFEAAGDTKKLKLLLSKFREIVEKQK